MKNFISVFPLIDHPIMTGNDKTENITSPGVTLRQLYAGMYMTGRVTAHKECEPERAFQMADKMIEFEADEMNEETEDEE